MLIHYIAILYFIKILCLKQAAALERQRRYLIFTPSTQWGVFATVSVPLPEPDTLVSVAWFFEANYYNVANASYFDPLLGDIELSSLRTQRSISNLLTRRCLYTFVENMLERHGYPGRECLLRAICESSSQFLHNGVLGDLLHLLLTPSTSISEEDVEDIYYEAEYWGLEGKCDHYNYHCPSNPVDNISVDLK
ncbi:uncharacterized protein LOC116768053 isoform X2 [Danaus plexippus]|uniref:uncharacterized protein LOC116768053 isoform X2 n=1 Tax=Danaus plexippus TaxID=13037 RepID=UPI002AB0865F|nr:uncharacterized protein LOC116768053 isoform X2 [Danaus plexippus]